MSTIAHQLEADTSLTATSVKRYQPYSCGSHIHTNMSAKHPAQTEDKPAKADCARLTLWTRICGIQLQAGS